MEHNKDKMGHKTNCTPKLKLKKGQTTKKIGHKPIKTMKLKLEQDTKQNKWDTDQVETKMGHQLNETLKLTMVHKTDKMGQKIDKIGH